MGTSEPIAIAGDDSLNDEDFTLRTLTFLIGHLHRVHARAEIADHLLEAMREMERGFYADDKASPV